MQELEEAHAVEPDDPRAGVHAGRRATCASRRSTRPTRCSRRSPRPGRRRKPTSSSAAPIAISEQYDRARAALQRALKMDPRVRRAHYYLGTMARARRRRRPARRGDRRVPRGAGAYARRSAGDAAARRGARRGAAPRRGAAAARAVGHGRRRRRTTPGSISGAASSRSDGGRGGRLPPARARHRGQDGSRREADVAQPLDPLSAGPALRRDRRRRPKRTRSSPRRSGCRSAQAASEREQLAQYHGGRGDAGASRRAAARSRRLRRARRRASAPICAARCSDAARPRVPESRHHAGAGAALRARRRALRAGGRGRSALPAGPVLARRRLLQRRSSSQGGAGARARARARRSRSNTDVRRMLALACARTRATTPRRPTCCATIRRCRSDPSLQYAYGLALVRSDRAAEAEKIFSRLLAEHPDVARAERRARPGIHAAQGDYDAAVDVAAARARAASRPSPKPTRRSGDIYLRQGRLPRPRRRCARSSPPSRQRRRRATRSRPCSISTASRDEALRELRSMLAARPNYADARYLFGKILLARGRRRRRRSSTSRRRRARARRREHPLPARAGLSEARPRRARGEGVRELPAAERQSARGQPVSSGCAVAAVVLASVHDACALAAQTGGVKPAPRADRSRGAARPGRRRRRRPAATPRR